MNETMINDLPPTKVANLLVTEDMMKMFDRTYMTIYSYRKNKNMPFVSIPGAKSKNVAVRYVYADVVKWAKDNDIKIVKKIKCHG